MQLSDEILISQIARGDRDALEILYDRHAPVVLGILIQVLDERATAEKMLQETFWQVWQRAATYSSQTGSLASWLFRMAGSLAIAEMKRHGNDQPRKWNEK